MVYGALEVYTRFLKVYIYIYTHVLRVLDMRI